MSLLTKYHYIFGSAGVVGFGALVFWRGNSYSDQTGFHSLDKDPSLRKIEKDVVIAKIMRDYAREEACVDEVKLFNECSKLYQGKPYLRNAFKTTYKCKPQCKVMMECMDNVFKNEDVYYMCKKKFMRKKILFTTTGVTVKNRQTLKDIISADPLSGIPRDMQDELDDDCEKARLYFSKTKEFYRNCNDIDAYENHLIESYKEQHKSVDL